MKAHDLWGREVVNQQADRVIVPTTDLILLYLERMKMAQNIHIDWPQVAKGAVEMAQSFEKLIELRDYHQFPRQLNTDADLEDFAFGELVLGLARRFYAIGFYTTDRIFTYNFDEFAGEDMVLRCYVYLPMPQGLKTVEPNDRMRIASLFQGH